MPQHGRRFQFTLKRMLLATFWMAVGCGGVMANRSIPPLWEFGGPRALWKCLTYATFNLPFILTGIAVGTLFGRAKVGAIIGFIVAALFCVVLSSINFFNRSPAETAQRVEDCLTSCLLLAAGILVAVVWRYRTVTTFRAPDQS
jgi:hypothetical protein